MVPQKLRGDRSLLVRALLNLTINALKFTEVGHVTISTTCISAQKNNTLVLGFEVLDSGRGMSPEELEKATRPYERASTSKSGGLGLGLTIVSKSVEMAGGRFNLASELHKGTRVGFELPFEIIEESDEPKSLGHKIRRRVMIVVSRSSAHLSIIHHTPLHITRPAYAPHYSNCAHKPYYKSCTRTKRTSHVFEYTSKSPPNAAQHTPQARIQHSSLQTSHHRHFAFEIAHHKEHHTLTRRGGTCHLLWCSEK